MSLPLMLLIANQVLTTPRHLVRSYNSKSETTTPFALRFVYGLLMAMMARQDCAVSAFRDISTLIPDLNEQFD
jgi:hypothetical protein